jgi:uncharacterized protein (TIGR03437 family)
VITVVAGDVTANQGGYYGDGGPAVGAGLNKPFGVALDGAGNLYIADTSNNRVRKVSTNGTITTVAGGGSNSTLGGQATQTYILSVFSVAVDSAGNIFLAEDAGGGGSSQVLKVAPNGVITNYAGNISAFQSGPNGDGGPATQAFILGTALALDSSGNLFIADQLGRIRKVSLDGTITTVAGSNTTNFSGDGGPATSAGLNNPMGVAVDSAGNLYIVDAGNYRIRKVTTDGTINTIAGMGKPGTSGDGGIATNAAIEGLSSIAVSSAGTVYFADTRRTDNESFVRALQVPVTPPLITKGGIGPVFSSANTVQPGEWVSIFGSNLASATATWNNDFPVSLGGTSVTIDNKPAYLGFVSPAQINLQVPDDSTLGNVNVVVTTSGGTAASTVTLGQFGPSFSLIASNYVAAIILRLDGSGAYGGGAYDIVGPTGSSLGYKTVAAKAGDTVELFGVGFGPTNPAIPAGRAYSGASATTNPVQIRINNVTVTAGFVGLVAAGLYQLNVQIPSGLGTGDVSLQATVGGSSTQTGVVISLQ